ncbi:NAD-dependent epimerase/dehydratase family protein [Marivita geojedonensis]|uniref:NAD-dependent epimerase/dehydratase family protein n=1 Tax=Marivita geojedonensis TaxID=1123756 RepID=UPI000A1F9431|nr:NAD(P)-dependent oxidoreductase [Marivita geojedonensis]PRY79900.1 nucleoside-diphosphate-sugar epimerase [Marivita geojedonensis]
MGDVRRILITGASGFIGQATVKAALNADLEVVAVQRRPGPEQAGISYVFTDLTQRTAISDLSEAMQNCDAVIHLAAAMSGDPTDHKRLTIGGTEHVIEAMQQAGVGHLTLASSLAVYDTRQIPIGGELTDDCPLEHPSMSRDSYSGAKVRQESLARAARFKSLSILRPGIVYDEEHLWNGHLGIGLGPVLLRIGNNDPLPLCHVERCAKALVLATLHRVNGTFTLVDPTLPTRGQVIGALQKAGWPKAVVPVPWQIPFGLARLLRPVSGNLPGLLREAVLRQRLLPMQFRLRAPFGEDQLPDPAPDWGEFA